MGPQWLAALRAEAAVLSLTPKVSGLTGGKEEKRAASEEELWENSKTDLKRDAVAKNCLPTAQTSSSLPRSSVLAKSGNQERCALRCHCRHCYLGIFPHRVSLGNLSFSTKQVLCARCVSSHAKLPNPHTAPEHDDDDLPSHFRPLSWLLRGYCSELSIVHLHLSRHVD